MVVVVVVADLTAPAKPAKRLVIMFIVVFGRRFDGHGRAEPSRVEPSRAEPSRVEWPAANELVCGGRIVVWPARLDYARDKWPSAAAADDDEEQQQPSPAVWLGAKHEWPANQTTNRPKVSLSLSKLDSGRALIERLAN